MKRVVTATLLPLLALAAVLVALVVTDVFQVDSPAPPTERLTVERVSLDSNGIEATLRAEGSDPVAVAQVQVDGAYWSFSQNPAGPISRLSAAQIRIPYPWVAGETHQLLFVTSTGQTFGHTIDVAIATSDVVFSRMWQFIFLGLAIGSLPIVIGMLAFPALRSGGAPVFTFALALTMGLLAFLFVDTLAEALEQAARVTPGFHARTMVWMAMLASAAGLLAIGHRRGAVPTGMSLAFFIALGIGLHNFGEGLAVGAAYATGAALLGTFLVVGFTLHNVTEGIGVVAPLLRLSERPNLRQLAGLACVAGLPVIPGIFLGAALVASHWTALALAIGAGAILQVIMEMGSIMFREHRRARTAALAAPMFFGLVTGIVVMYGTAFLVQAK